MSVILDEHLIRRGCLSDEQWIAGHPSDLKIDYSDLCLNADTLERAIRALSIRKVILLTDGAKLVGAVVPAQMFMDHYVMANQGCWMDAEDPVICHKLQEVSMLAEEIKEGLTLMHKTKPQSPLRRYNFLMLDAEKQPVMALVNNNFLKCFLSADLSGKCFFQERYRADFQKGYYAHYSPVEEQLDAFVRQTVENYSQQKLYRLFYAVVSWDKARDFLDILHDFTAKFSHKKRSDWFLSSNNESLSTSPPSGP